jgi:arylsulfatase A-like enzyme
MGKRGLANIEDDGAAEALEWVRGTDFGDNEFLFMNLMEAHAPYDPPAEYATTTLKSSPSLTGCVSGSDVDRNVLRQAYDDSVRYLSDMYEDIFEQLASEFDYVITLGDHGEMFGESGIWGHAHSVHPELTHVPLAIYHEELEGSTDELVSLLDVHKTVLDLSGCDTSSRGQNLLEAPQSRTYLTERLGLNERRRGGLRSAGVPEERIERYDTTLRGIAIPDSYYGHQMLDTFSEHGESTVDDPEARLQEAVDELDIADVDVASGEDIPDDVRQRLQDLGYA